MHSGEFGSRDIKKGYGLYREGSDNKKPQTWIKSLRLIKDQLCRSRGSEIKLLVFPLAQLQFQQKFLLQQPELQVVPPELQK